MKTDFNGLISNLDMAEEIIWAKGFINRILETQKAKLNETE